MTGMRHAAEDYLQIRRSLGFKLKDEGRLVLAFVDYMDTVAAQTLTVDHALRWASLPPSAKPVYVAKRLTAVRGFARYLQTIDPGTEVPATDLLGGTKWRRPTPYIYSDQDITMLMAAAEKLKTRLGAATMHTLVGLLTVTGMRIGEAIGLDRDDLDLQRARLVVRNSKFGKSRLLPLHPSTVAALRDYLEVRDRLKPWPASTALLIGARGGRLNRDGVEWTFRLLCDRTGLTDHAGSRRPRLHDIRHSFAVKSMLDSYRNGDDPVARMSLLSTYLGHADPGNTYWYLSAAPELLALAAQRLEDDLTEARS